MNEKEHIAQIVLVTGLIGSGKSAVCEILRRKGFPVYDSDSHAKAMYAEDKELARIIEKEVGLKISQLSEVFSDAQRLARLEAIIHPRVLKDFLMFVANSGAPLVFFESAIALSKPLFQGMFDKVLVVRASKEKRIKRNPKAAQRNDFQQDTMEYDYLIENEGTLEELEEKVNNFLSKITDL